MTHSLNRLLCIFERTDDAPEPSVPSPAMGLAPADPAGLPDNGLMLIGDIWLTGDISALVGAFAGNDSNSPPPPMNSAYQIHTYS